jgi:phosphopantetheine--protein transferase-like protein
VAKCADMINVKVIRDSYDETTIEKIHELLIEELKIKKNNLKIARTPEGKLYIQDGLSNIEISVSHSDGNFVLGMNEQNVKIGLDIERIRNREINSRVVERFFSVDEQKAILSSENPSEELLRFWSRKESLVKCLGTGMILPFASINTLGELVLFEGKKYRIKSQKKKFNEMYYWLSVALQSEAIFGVEFCERGENE